MYGQCLFLIFFVGAFKIVLSEGEEVQLSCDDIENIVDYHNKHREMVAAGEVKGQPAASNMKYMVWDDELANKAKSWSLQGEFSHNPDRSIRSGRFTVGENIYYSTSTDSNYNFDRDGAMKAWFDEYNVFQFGALSEADFETEPDMQIGHYTQMVWSSTTRIGCGLSKTSRSWGISYLFVCNYGPAGNTFGEEPYASSDSGTALVCNEDDDCNSPYGETC